MTRRVTDKWRISFAYNPLRDVDYEELSVRERVLILHALCHWRLGDSEELMQFIEQQEVNWTGHKSTMVCCKFELLLIVLIESRGAW